MSREWSGRQCESSGGSKGTEQELTSERKWGQDHEAFSHARTLDFNHAIESYWKLWASCSDWCLGGCFWLSCGRLIIGDKSGSREWNESYSSGPG